MKATAVAHPIQGLIKYHGLRDVRLRVPFHDSISVCTDALYTTTTVETDRNLKEDFVSINGVQCTQADKQRIELVLSKLRTLADYDGHFRMASENSITYGKGLGFSASAFAALGAAACKALDIDVNYVTLSEIVRLGAGSATRSLAGSFAIWYANRKGKSYAESLVSTGAVTLGMIIIPLFSPIKTDEAHREVLTSPLFKARLKHIARTINNMKRAIRCGDVATIGQLAEADTLNLHASTMTGRSHLVLWEPETVRAIHEVQKMRSQGFDVWYSMDTGPSVFINTHADLTEDLASKFRKMGFKNVVTSGVGGKPLITEKHLF